MTQKVCGTGNPIGLKITAVGVATTILAACATPAPPAPPPPPPPPPPVEIIPTRPLPPGGASYVMNIPEKDFLGRRDTINRGISDDEKIWHFRSAWNVAALNCTSATFDPVLDAYSRYIKVHSSALKKVNARIDAEFREQAGARRAGLLAREKHMTSVYNFFALPPVRRGFCAAALELSNRANAAPPTDPSAFALANFALLRQPFTKFFEDYETYQRESAIWDRDYGAEYGPSQPGWVAVQNARAQGIPVPTVGEDTANTVTPSAPTTGVVTDPTTGAEVPIVPTDPNFVSQPVVEPVPTDGDEAQPAPPPQGLR